MRTSSRDASLLALRSLEYHSFSQLYDSEAPLASSGIQRLQRRAALSIAVSQSSHLATSKNGHREDEEGGIKTGFIRSLSLMGAPWRRFSALMRLKRRPVN